MTVSAAKEKERALMLPELDIHDQRMSVVCETQDFRNSDRILEPRPPWNLSRLIRIESEHRVQQKCKCEKDKSCGDGPDENGNFVEWESLLLGRSDRSWPLFIPKCIKP